MKGTLGGLLLHKAAFFLGGLKFAMPSRELTDGLHFNDAKPGGQNEKSQSRPKKTFQNKIVS